MESDSRGITSKRKSILSSELPNYLMVREFIFNIYTGIYILIIAV